MEFCCGFDIHLVQINNVNLSNIFSIIGVSVYDIEGVRGFLSASTKVGEKGSVNEVRTSGEFFVIGHALLPGITCVLDLDI